jgi:CubicO group peptidase (beta-lactamase class C family)
MVRHLLVLLLLIAVVRQAGAQDSSARDCGAPAAAIGDGWTLATPADAGLDPRALCEINTLVGQWPEANSHAVTVVRHGRLVLERYWRGQDQRYGPSLGVVQFAPDVKHDLRSISKSVTSMLLGIASDEGHFPLLDSPVLDSSPDSADLRTPGKMASPSAIS